LYFEEIASNASRDSVEVFHRILSGGDQTTHARVPEHCLEMAIHRIVVLPNAI
jgi:hypothetical protein